MLGQMRRMSYEYGTITLRMDRRENARKWMKIMRRHIDGSELLDLIRLSSVKLLNLLLREARVDLQSSFPTHPPAVATVI